MISIGERIKMIRKENFYTQADFANLLGISQGTLSDIEKDKCYPSCTSKTKFFLSKINCIVGQINRSLTRAKIGITIRFSSCFLLDKKSEEKAWRERMWGKARRKA
ncbi:hypothetical protein G3A_16250 [Bacillus sp. 17376]|uniref:helix-turn-helix transcriptional regulator n=1 Tax=Mesobacillus boroniphilus TaxID=308892 RepID=UPI0003C7AE15|nr:helix-turn-helix transcriptional regulator [Mesobacillus boroniphilus]ESU31519.1 hypothetical protein G3A_16250 [Bacillus sp. 17376]